MTDKRDDYYKSVPHHGRYSLPTEGPTPDDYHRLERQIRELYDWAGGHPSDCTNTDCGRPCANCGALIPYMRELWPWLADDSAREERP